jgi:hypothetical protein
VSYTPEKIEVTTHYVVEIRVQEVKVSVSSGGQYLRDHNVTSKTTREVRELGHYIHTEKVLGEVLVKGAQLLRLAGPGDVAAASDVR